MTPSKTPRKIAYIVGGLPFGGVENWLLDLSLNLRNDPDITPYVINVSGTGALMPAYEEHGIPVISIGNGDQAINTHRLDTLLKLRKVLKDLDVDLVHTLHFSGDYFGRLAALGLGVPVVSHIRNIKSERKAKRRVINKLLSWCTTQYLSVSRAAAQTIERDHNVAKRPVRVLYNAVDPKKLDVAPTDLKTRYGLRGKTVIGVGRVVKQKNFDRLIKAMAIVKERVPEASLLILGDGSMMPDLKRLRSELGLERDVCLAGFVANTEIPAHLRACSILAMPSDYEGLPITHVEALFCGLPAVISEHVPSAEIAAESSLICTTEVEDIADKIALLLENDELHASMAQKALDAAPQFSMENYLTQLKSVYDDLL